MKNTKKRAAVIYTRVSSKPQEEEGFSIDAQLKLLRAYAKRHDLSVRFEYKDVETAKKAGRKEFDKMVTFLKKEAKAKSNEMACRTILVEKTDRLYRNLKDYSTLDDLGIEIHLVKEHAVLTQDSDSDAQFMHGIRVLMARKYIHNLSEETKKGLTEKAEQGIYPSVAPLGYENVEWEKKKVIQPHAVIGPQIIKLFEWYATGLYSLRELREKAYEEGLTLGKNGKKISKSALHKLLKNPIYYGDFIWNGKLYHGIHEPLVSKELFEHVQDVLGEKGQHRSQQKKYSWAFQGMLICGHCGCAVTAEIKKKRYIYYHCTAHKGKCPEKYVREEEVDRKFGEALEAIQLDEDVLAWLVKALKESHKDEKKFHKEQITTLQQEYTKLQNRLEAMYEDKLDGLITQEFYEHKSLAWRSMQDKILEKIEKHQNANRAYLDEGIKVLELSQEAVKLYEKLPMFEKRGILESVLLSNSIWKNGRLHPKYRQPFELLAVTNRKYQRQKAASPTKSDLRSVWLPGPDSNQRQIG